MTLKHTISCPTCGNQKEFLIVPPTTVVFTCCKAHHVTLYKRTNENMTTDVVAIWKDFRYGANLPRYTDWRSWGIRPVGNNKGYVVVDEYDELLVDDCYESEREAHRVLHDMQIEEQAALEDHGPCD